MVFKHPGPTPSGGWLPAAQNQPDGSMWQQGFTQQNFNQFPYQHQHQQAVSMNTDTRHMQQSRLGLLHQHSMGMMGPPPVPQKHFAVSAPSSVMAMGNRPTVTPQSVPMMMNPSYRQEMMHNKNSGDILSARRSQPPQNFSSNSLSFNPHLQSDRASGMLWPQHRNTGTMLDTETVDDLVEIERLQDILGPIPNTPTSSATMRTPSQSSRLGDSKPDPSQSPPPHPTYTNRHPASVTSSASANVTQASASSASTDLRQIQSTPLQSPLPHMMSQPAQQQPQQPRLNTHPTPLNSDKMDDLASKVTNSQMAGTLPHPNQLLPPMSGGGGVTASLSDDQSKKLMSSANSVNSDKDNKNKRTRRKKCGECTPCHIKEDCGQCYVCKNKGQVNAICKSRKCLLLRKKVTLPYHLSVGMVTLVWSRIHIKLNGFVLCKFDQTKFLLLSGPFIFHEQCIKDTSFTFVLI